MASFSGRLIGILLVSVVNGVYGQNENCHRGGRVKFKVMKLQKLDGETIKHECLDAKTKRMTLLWNAVKIRDIKDEKFQLTDGKVTHKSSINKGTKVKIYNIKDGLTYGVDIPCFVPDVTFKFKFKFLTAGKAKGNVTIRFRYTPVTLQVNVWQRKDRTCDVTLQDATMLEYKVRIRLSRKRREVYSAVRDYILKLQLFRDYLAQLRVFAYHILQALYQQKKGIVTSDVKDKLNTTCNCITYPWKGTGDPEKYSYDDRFDYDYHFDSSMVQDKVEVVDTDKDGNADAEGYVECPKAPS